MVGLKRKAESAIGRKRKKVAYSGQAGKPVSKKGKNTLVHVGEMCKDCRGRLEKSLGGIGRRLTKAYHKNCVSGHPVYPK